MRVAIAAGLTRVQAMVSQIPEPGDSDSLKFSGNGDRQILPVVVVSGNECLLTGSPSAKDLALLFAGTEFLFFVSSLIWIATCHS